MRTHTLLRSSSRLIAICTLAVALSLGLFAMARLGASEQLAMSETELVAAASSRERLAPAAQAFKVGLLREAAARLRNVREDALKSEDALLWRALAGRTALRLGDRKWLEEINKDGEQRLSAYDVTLAGSLRAIMAAEYDEARILLNQIKDPKSMTEVQQRRYHALFARMAQLQGNPRAELVNLEPIIVKAVRWPDVDCQACHADPDKYGNKVTTFNLRDWWAGQRYVEALRATKSASAVKQQALQRIAKGQNVRAERLRLAYALRALGDEEGYIKNLRTFAWAEFPDRPVRTALQIEAYP